MKDLKLVEYSKSHWEFYYPEEMTHYDNDLDNAITDLYFESKNARIILKDLIRLFPYHIDAYHHLALIEENENNIEEAHNLWSKAVSIGLNCLPNRKHFVFGRDLIQWSNVDNRPFMRAYHALGLSFMKRGDYEKSLIIWERLLQLNPNDNQGIRDLYALNCLELNRYYEIIELKKRYKECNDLDLDLCLVLVYFTLNQKQKAIYYLKNLFKYNKQELQSLFKKNIKKPETIGSYCDGLLIENADYIIYNFYKFNIKYWKETEGALNFLREFINSQNKS
jgi:tetratricopeptide (TPR) repeat protein